MTAVLTPGAAPLKDVADWIERYRRFWDQSVDRLEVYLKKPIHEPQA